MNQKATLVLFDVGAVLVKLDYGDFYAHAAQQANVPLDTFKKQFSAIEMDALLGKIPTAEFLSRVRALGLERVSDKDLAALLRRCWPDEIKGMVQLKRQLHQAGYRVGIFSNMSEYALLDISGRFPSMLDTYDPSSPAVYSSRAGSVKPQPAIYGRFKRYGFQKVVFIDDKASYLRAGIEQLEWYGIHYTEHINLGEAIRTAHQEQEFIHPRFRTAESVDAARAALQEFGVHV
ncbi:hypothetical protein HY491_01530 [Candidatus Woesearchaeota archaeon]|nr:hypothetical protein [Candidatus Woesearchaeota archaeon]